MPTLLLLALCVSLLTSPAPAQNRVLELDGKGSYAQLPAHIFDSLQEATVEAWGRWDDWAHFSQWFAFGADDQWRAMGVNHFSETPNLQFFIYTGQALAQGWLHLVPVAVDLPLGQWCHMAAVSGPGGMRFYLNGTLVGQNGFEGSFAAIGAGENNYLGRSNWKDNAYFHGQLDEVRVWSMARSGEEIRAGMGQKLRGDEAGLVGLWNFDGGDARDVSPQGHHGQLRGGARCLAAPFPGAGPVRRPAVVEGRVRDETGVPLGGAAVHLRRGEAKLVGLTTRQNGRYTLGSFEPGLHTLEVDLSGSFLQWYFQSSPDLGMAAILPQEVLLQEGQGLHLDLSVPSSQVAQWSGEEDARDALGGHDGTLMGGTTFAPGLVGQAFSLDEAGDFVRVPHRADLDLSGSFSLVAWVFPTVGDRLQVLCEKWTQGAPRGSWSYALVVEPGLRLRFTISDEAHGGDTSYHNFVSPANVLTLHIWNQVAAVYDQATGMQWIYVNGVEVARHQDPPLAQATSSQDLLVGGTDRPTSFRRSFKGLMDEVSFYRRALPETSIQRLYGVHAEAHWPGEGDAEDLRAGLRLAAEMHNVTDLRKGLEQLQGLGVREAQLAAHLSERVQAFDLEGVLTALERTKDG